MKSRITGLIFIVVSLTWALAQTPGEPPAGETVDLSETLEGTLLLQNGDRITGQVIDPAISVETQLGELAIPQGLVRFVVQQQRDVSIVFLQSGDRITGSPSGTGLNLQTAASDSPLTVAWTLISVLTFPPVNTDPGPHQIVLINNDWLSGFIETEQFTVQTRFGTVQIAVDQIRNATRVTSGQNFIFSLQDGDRITGWLPEQTVSLRVAGGELLELTMNGESLQALFLDGGS